MRPPRSAGQMVVSTQRKMFRVHAASPAVLAEKRANLVALYRRYGIATIQYHGYLPFLAYALLWEEGPTFAAGMLDQIDQLSITEAMGLRLRLTALFERMRLEAVTGRAVKNAEVYLRTFADQLDARAPHGHAKRVLQDLADRFDRLRQRYPLFVAEGYWSRDAVEKVVDCILAAHTERRPFSLIRLGDGEGRFLPYSATERHWAISDQKWQQQLFWGVIDLDSSSLERLKRSLETACRNADVVGIPYLSRLRQDLLDALPVPEVLSRASPDCRAMMVILDHLEGRLSGADGPIFNSAQMLTSALIHCDLSAWRLYERLFTQIRRVAVISCHPTLRERLTQLYDIEVTRLYPIPPEHFWRDKYAYERGGVHYPDRFLELERELTVSEPGEVFLVAAGILGKIYCDWIKTRGGIALDIGSVADYWYGVETRGPWMSQGFYPLPISAVAQADVPSPVDPAAQDYSRRFAVAHLRTSQAGDPSVLDFINGVARSVEIAVHAGVGAKTSGLYEVEDYQGDFLRWTSGVAVLTVPNDPEKPAKTLTLSLWLVGPTEKTRSMQLRVNGAVLYDGPIQLDSSNTISRIGAAILHGFRRVLCRVWWRHCQRRSLRLPRRAAQQEWQISSFEASPTIQIQITADTFSSPGDPRELGVALRELTLARSPSR